MSESSPGPPSNLFSYVLEFCRSISTEQPLFLRPTPGSDDVALECMENIRQRIEQEGGSSEPGWKIWEWPGVMIEAEFHVVWRSPEGALRDITPNQAPLDRALFLPDPQIQYEGRQIDNVRRPLIGDPRVAEFIRAAEIQFELMNRGERAFQHGEVELSHVEAAQYHKLERQKLELLVAIDSSKPGRNDLCRCGSGNKFKRCCGR